MAKAKVRYKGLSDERIISKKDLKQRSIDVNEDLVFNARNGYSMELDMNEDLEKILKGEGTFSIQAIKDDGGEGSPEVEPTGNSDETSNAGATIIDTTTGQKSTRK